MIHTTELETNQSLIAVFSLQTYRQTCLYPVIPVLNTTVFEIVFVNKELAIVPRLLKIKQFNIRLEWIALLRTAA